MATKTKTKKKPELNGIARFLISDKLELDIQKTSIKFAIQDEELHVVARQYKKKNICAEIMSLYPLDVEVYRDKRYKYYSQSSDRSLPSLESFNKDLGGIADGRDLLIDYFVKTITLITGYKVVYLPQNIITISSKDTTYYIANINGEIVTGNDNYEKLLVRQVVLNTAEPKLILSSACLSELINAKSGLVEAYGKGTVVYDSLKPDLKVGSTNKYGHYLFVTDKVPMVYDTKGDIIWCRHHSTYSTKQEKLLRQDKHLIRIISEFGEYIKTDESNLMVKSLKVGDDFSVFNNDGHEAIVTYNIKDAKKIKIVQPKNSKWKCGFSTKDTMIYVKDDIKFVCSE